MAAIDTSQVTIKKLIAVLLIHVVLIVTLVVIVVAVVSMSKLKFNVPGLQEHLDYLLSTEEDNASTQRSHLCLGA